MRSVFGWDLPPGCSTRDIDHAAGVDLPCTVCARFDDACICPECHVCGEIGNPMCYGGPPAVPKGEKDHGLKLSRQQVIARQEARIAMLKDRLSDEGTYLDYLNDGGQFSDDINDNPDPWG